MYLLCIFSIIASSVTLVTAITAVAFASHYELHHRKEMRKYHPSRFWPAILDLAVSLVTTVGFSIALLVCSISWSVKWIEIILVLFGRVLLIKQVSIPLYAQTLAD
jgi:hypothetical protein